jgi:hypothetical protein
MNWKMNEVIMAYFMALSQEEMRKATNKTLSLILYHDNLL